MVRRRWLQAALALRRCVNVNCALIRSAHLREQRSPRAHTGTSNAKAGDVGSEGNNSLFTANGSTDISSIDGIDFQETIPSRFRRR